MFWSEETCRNSCIQLFFQVTTHTLCMWSFDLSFSYGFQEYEWNPSDITWHTELRNVRLKVCKWADETLSVLMKALLQLFVIYTHEALAAVGIYASVMLTHTGLLRKKNKKKNKNYVRTHEEARRSDLVNMIQIQCYTVVFVASWVLSETVSETVTAQKSLIPPPCR